jgi:hypothetical protein
VEPPGEKGGDRRGGSDVGRHSPDSRSVGCDLP